MRPFDMITEAEKQLIVNYIKTFGARRTPHGSMASIGKILNQWDKAKSKQLFKMFGEKLILEYPITIEKHKEQLLDDMYNAFREKPEMEKFCNDWINILYHHFEEEDNYVIFGKTYRSKKPSQTFWDLDYLINKSTLVNNVCEKSFDVPTPDGSIIQARPGMKLMRLIGKIATAFNIPGFEEFRIAHSMVLNDKKLYGNLCLSIHPMDYMTMSDNFSHWSSCMSWQEDGDYRAGTIEMMNSPCVVVAYLKSSEDMTYWVNNGQDTWNNKKWRCLFVVDKDVIFHVKNYPYNNNSITDQCLFFLKELAEKNLGYHYDNEVTVFDSFKTFEYKGVTRGVHPHTEIMYNDCSSHQRGILNPEPEENILNINFSGIYTCMWCGEVGDVPSDSVVCYDCSDDYRCCSCGEYLDPDETYEYCGEIYCESCYNDMFYTDDLTDESIHESEVVNLYLFENDEALRDKHRNGKYLRISTCVDSINDKNTWGKYFTTKVKTFTDRWNDEKFYITVKDCSEDGFALFGYFDAKSTLSAINRT